MNLLFYPSKALTKDAVLDLITRFGIGIVLLVRKQQNAAIGSRVFAKESHAGRYIVLLVNQLYQID